MESKGLTSVEVKDASEGRVTAVFSTLGVVDKDNDVTLKGAFKPGQEVVISSYNHKSWEGALPVGKGVIGEQGDKAVCDMQFFMDTTHGRDAFNTVKSLGALGEWSYGYDVVKSDLGSHEGKSVRFLKELHVYEVSPVLRGAGEGTRTMSAKADTSASGRRREAANGSAEPDGSYPIENAHDVRAAVDDYNHSGGNAKDKAHIIARARAIGAEDMLPAAWRQGKSLNEEISYAVAAVRDAIESAERVAALRAESGKSLSNVNRKSLEELDEALLSLTALLTEETETKSTDNAAELDSLYLAFVASNL